MRRVIRAGRIVTMDPAIGDLANTDLIVEGDKISGFAPTGTVDGDEVIDVPDGIAFPGLINAHIHLWQAASRAMAGDWTLADYFNQMMVKLNPVLTADDVHIGTYFGALEQLDGGVTTLLDWCQLSHTPAHAHRAIDALEESGIRAIFAQGPSAMAQDWFRHPDDDHPRDIVDMRTGRLASDDNLIRLAMAARGPDYTSDEVLVRDITLAKDLGLLAAMHAGMGGRGKGPGGVAKLHRLGLLGPHINIAHGNMFADDEYRLLGDSGAFITVTPEIEMQMGMGQPATGKIIAGGGKPTLGVDIVSNVSGDMFTQMRMALQTQRMLHHMPVLARNEIVQSVGLTVREILAAATIDAATALGLGSVAGSLTPGKSADIAVLCPSRAWLGPCQNPVDAIVLQGSASTIDTVMVAGKLHKRDGALLDTRRTERYSALIACHRAVLERAGLSPSPQR